MEEEEDEEEHLNKTQNPLNDDTLISLISTIGGTEDPWIRAKILSSFDEEETDEVWINAKTTKATEIQMEINLRKKETPLEEQIPKEFHEYLDVFSEEKAARFPEPKIKSN